MQTRPLLIGFGILCVTCGLWYVPTLAQPNLVLPSPPPKEETPPVPFPSTPFLPGPGVPGPAKEFPLIPTPGFPESSPVTHSRTVAMVLSPDRTRIWAYSSEKGEWKKPSPLKILPGETIQPLLAENMLCFQAGQHVYGFSGLTGTWDAFQVPRGVHADLEVTSEMVIARFGTVVSIFSARRGEWEGLDWARH